VLPAQQAAELVNNSRNVHWSVICVLLVVCIHKWHCVLCFETECANQLQACNTAGRWRRRLGVPADQVQHAAAVRISASVSLLLSCVWNMLSGLVYGEVVPCSSAVLDVHCAWHMMHIALSARTIAFCIFSGSSHCLCRQASNLV